MTGASPQLASEHSGASPKSRSPLAHLLHALNQPLTGLQCSLELAAAGPRHPEQYARTLHQGLELTSRMRILVEAIRELADIQESARETSDSDAVESFPLDVLLRDTVADLLPVAESRSVHLLLRSEAPLPVRSDRGRLATLLFRFFESALSLTREGGDLRIAATPDPGHDPGQVCLMVSWLPGPPPEHSPFSPQELGLLIAEAGWEQMGGGWIHTRTETTQTCRVQLPLASGRFPAQPFRPGDSK